MKRWIPAPADCAFTANNAVQGVLLDDTEQVEWIYTIQSNGQRVVTGYTILPNLSQRK